MRDVCNAIIINFNKESYLEINHSQTQDDKIIKFMYSSRGWRKKIKYEPS